MVLYDVPDHDAAQLDRWEGGELGLHKKLRLRVHTLDGDVLAWIYVLDAYEGGLPSARYLGGARGRGRGGRCAGRLRGRTARPSQQQVLLIAVPRLPHSRMRVLRSCTRVLR